MKKLYFFLMVLLSLVGVTQAFAQEDDVTIEVRIDNGHWVEWNGNTNVPVARSWYSDTKPAISFCSTMGGNNTTDIRGNVFKGANNITPWGDDGNNLQFYTSNNTYQIMVENGWYIKSVEFDFNAREWTLAHGNYDEGSNSITIGDEDPVISSSPEDNQHVEWFNVEDDKTIYFVNIKAEKQSTNHSYVRTSNFTVVVAPLGEQQQALADLAALYKQYEDFKSKFTVGDKPGQYSEEAVQAFLDALEDANADGPDFDNTLSVEDLKALGQALVDAYEAVLKTKVPMSLETGYYRIYSALPFTETYDDDEGAQVVDENVTKYMGVKLADGKYNVKWYTPEDMDVEAPALWKVEQKDTLFDIVNGAFEYHFADTNPFTLSEGSDSLISIEPIGTDENDITTVAFRLVSKTVDGNSYFHISGHNSGKQSKHNSNGNIVTWYPDAAASQWVFESVSEGEAKAIFEAYAAIKERELMLMAYDTLMTASKRELGKALKLDIVKMTINTEQNLITSADQLSSPWTESSEGSLANIIDGSKTTYWHSAWSAGSVANHTHYLQVALTEAIDYDIAMTIARRAVANDHITAWTVFGSNDAEAADEEWSYLAYLTTPFGNNTETLNTLPFSTKGNQYLRFYIDGTTTGRGYGHVSEFQLNPAQLDEEQTVTFLNEAMALNNLVGVYSLKDRDEIQQEDFNTLMDAYNALMAKFVSNEKLRKALAETKGTDKLIKVGSNPGEWADDSQATAFQQLYGEAQDYYDGGTYTEEQIEDYVTRLTEMKKNILNSANKIQTGKWYKIRFDNEANFVANEWDLVAGKALTVETQDQGTITTSQPLWDKVVAVAKLDSKKTYYKRVDKAGTEEETIVDDSTTVHTVLGAQPTEVGSGNGIYFIDENNLSNKDMALFRFVAVGDSAYVLQNKATGLFLKGISNGSTVNASLHPTLFDASAIGYGKNLISVRTLSTGSNLYYLHGQKASNALVTWNADTPESASALYIEEVETVADGYVGQANIMMEPGTINAICYPGELTPTTTGDAGQAWTVSGIEGNKITLAKITDKIHAGRPFLFVNGLTSWYQENAPAEPVTFMVSTDNFAAEPQTNLPLKGTYARTGLHKGDVYCQDTRFCVATINAGDVDFDNKTVYVAGNSAYISNEPAINHNAELEVIFDKNAEDGILAAIEAVSKAGAVYTIDGRLVSRRATINELSRFGKGLYILNGHKVIVK